ncbi:MAG: 50S ribosomal protein L4 [Clostridia bacterium]|jgi:50S ribosomal protein L4|nr:50S ribosomal protein L4 [Clostridia bacterium]CDC79468.1 50S ribosomal protein L4 [Clostridium sp. CAG:465]
MLKVDVLDMKGKKVKDIELNENVFGVDVNDIVVHTALVNYLANQRQGTGSTKTRAEVRGGGRKPWRQKGTGRARQGSIRAPQWMKGGIALGPKPRSYKYAIPKKMRKLALKSVLTSKVEEKELIVVDKLELKEIKTKEMVKVLNNLNTKKALIVLSEKNLNVQASARNIENVKTTLVNTINVFDLLKYDNLVVTEDAIKKLEEVYA